MVGPQIDTDQHRFVSGPSLIATVPNICAHCVHLWLKQNLWRFASHETAFFRTELRLRALPVSLRDLGDARCERNAVGHFQRGFSSIITESGSLLPVPARAGESCEIQTIFGEPADFAQGSGH